MTIINLIEIKSRVKLEFKTGDVIKSKVIKILLKKYLRIKSDYILYKINGNLLCHLWKNSANRP